MAKKVWYNSGNNLFLRDISNTSEKLAPGVYKLGYIDPIDEFYLEPVSDKFTFPYKIYGAEMGFVNRISKTYDNTTGNMGILLNGVKGTGKTVTAELIANKLNLPVIIINQAYKKIPEYINSIEENVLLFFDEYEKMYNNYDHSILTVMDGVLNTEYRRVFLLTTNSIYLNENMLQRPGRIRYKKTFGDLHLQAILEIVDDKLINKKFKDITIQFISELELITIDIVKAVVEEINIHDENPYKFKDIFNIQSIDNVFNLYEVSGESSKIFRKEVELNFVKLTPDIVGQWFAINGDTMGIIKAVHNDELLTVEEDQDDDDDDDATKGVIVRTLRIENVKKKHNSFSNYVF